MYKRISCASLQSSDDIYFAMKGFMVECGFIEVDNDSTTLFPNQSGHNCVLQDPNTIHHICLSQSGQNDGCIMFFIIDSYDSTKPIEEQENAPIDIAADTTHRYAVGNIIKFNLYGSNTYFYDLVCVYTNKALMFIYTPTDCYFHSHFCHPKSRFGGQLLFYGNFTKYHLPYDEDIILTFTSPYGCYEGSPSLIDNERHVDNVSLIWGEVYCKPEASYRMGDKKWFTTDATNYVTLPNAIIKRCHPLLTSFDNNRLNGIKDVPMYYAFFANSYNRDKLMFGSTLNNTTVLMPLIVYGMREPFSLHTWSAIGETKLVNLIDMSHLHSGELFIDSGIESDMHRYFVFPAFHPGPADDYPYIGMAIEIEAKEDLLHSQSEDYLTISLNDRFRNFDRIEVVYGDNKEVEWLCDDLEALYNTDGVFNLTKDSIIRCLVYGLKNTNGESTEYRFTCSESCKIISITGYRE